MLSHPNHLGAWWYEAPGRRVDWWKQVLFEKGQGWLRWGTDQRDSREYDDNVCASYICGVYTVAPPARRLFAYLRQWFYVPRLMVLGVRCARRGQALPFLSWEEAQPIWPSDMRCEDRPRLFA